MSVTMPAVAVAAAVLNGRSWRISVHANRAPSGTITAIRIRSRRLMSSSSGERW